MRSALHYNWSRFQNIFLFSPTDAIQTYFGEEVGLYFAFITVYTIGRPNSTSGIHGLAYQSVQTEQFGKIREIWDRIEPGPQKMINPVRKIETPDRSRRTRPSENFLISENLATH